MLLERFPRCPHTPAAPQHPASVSRPPPMIHPNPWCSSRSSWDCGCHDAVAHPSTPKGCSHHDVPWGGWGAPDPPLPPLLTLAAPSISTVPGRALARVLHPRTGPAACWCLARVGAVVARVHWGILGTVCGVSGALAGGKRPGRCRGGGEQPIPLISDTGITALPQHPCPIWGPVAVPPSATPAVAPPCQERFVSSCLEKKKKSITSLFWLFLGKVSTPQLWEQAGDSSIPQGASPGWVL